MVRRDRISQDIFLNKYTWLGCHVVQGVEATFVVAQSDVLSVASEENKVKLLETSTQMACYLP